MEIHIYELEKNSDKARIIAQIHQIAFPNFFLTQLGIGFLTTLYQGYIEDPMSGIIVVENDNNRILGFIAYSKDYSKFYSKLKRKHLFKFAVCSLGAAICHPSFIKRLLGAFKKSDEVKRSEKYVELASIGVLKNVQGEGIGKKLIGYLISNIDFEIYEYISLETDAVNNDKVNEFYKKNGFKFQREYTTTEGRLMNEYRLRPEVNV